MSTAEYVRCDTCGVLWRGAVGDCSCGGYRYPERTCCDGCGDVEPQHWREGGWYCEGCAACEVCLSPYCDEPEHCV